MTTLMSSKAQASLIFYIEEEKYIGKSDIPLTDHGSNRVDDNCGRQNHYKTSVVCRL